MEITTLRAEYDPAVSFYYIFIRSQVYSIQTSILLYKYDTEIIDGQRRIITIISSCYCYSGFAHWSVKLIWGNQCCINRYKKKKVYIFFYKVLTKRLEQSEAGKFPHVVVHGIA